MIHVSERLSGAVNKQTVMTINKRKIDGPMSSHNITCLNSPKTNGSPQAAETAFQETAPDNMHAVFTSTPVPSFTNPIKKGQKAALETQKKLTKIQAKLGWSVTNPACDVDVSAFLLNATGKVIGDSWFVFYGQQSSPDGSTVFSTDQETNRETISVDFTKLNPAVAKIVFVLTINEALQKHLNFSMLKDAYICIIDASNAELVSFKMEDYYANVTSMMIGELYQYNGIWKFNAIGNGVARDLAGLCEYYGVEVV